MEESSSAQLSDTTASIFVSFIYNSLWPA